MSTILSQAEFTCHRPTADNPPCVAPVSETSLLWSMLPISLAETFDLGHAPVCDLLAVPRTWKMGKATY
jgi:hypothetical protein